MSDYRRVIKVKCKRTKQDIFIKEDRFNPEFHQVVKNAPAPVSLNSFVQNLEEQKRVRSRYAPPAALLAAQKELEENAARSGEYVPKVDNPQPATSAKRTNEPQDIGDKDANEVAARMMSDPMPAGLFAAKSWAKRKGMKTSQSTTMAEIEAFANEKGLR